MRTKAELQQDILNIAMKIQMEFPELTKYIQEMPSLFLTKELDHKHTETLELYYNKLKTVIVEYTSKDFNLEPMNEPGILNFSNNTNSSMSNNSQLYGKVEIQLMPEDQSKNQIEEMISSDEKDFRII